MLRQKRKRGVRVWGRGEWYIIEDDKIKGGGGGRLIIFSVGIAREK